MVITIIAKELVGSHVVGPIAIAAPPHMATAWTVTPWRSPIAPIPLRVVPTTEEMETGTPMTISVATPVVTPEATLAVNFLHLRPALGEFRHRSNSACGKRRG